MEVRRYAEPSALLADARPLLLAQPARNNLPLAILQTLIDQPAVYPLFRLWPGEHEGVPVGLAMQTEPFNVLRAEPARENAVDQLADAVLDDGGSLPGVRANRPGASGSPSASTPELASTSRRSCAKASGTERGR